MESLKNDTGYDVCNIAVVILCAGNGTRMGNRNKLVMEIEGVPLYERIWRELFKVDSILPSHIKITQKILVTAYDEIAENAESHKGYKLSVIRNDDQDQGQSHSIKLGLEQVDKDVDGVMFCPSDQPFVTRDILCQLMDYFADSNKIIVPSYDGKNTSPCIFPRRFIGNFMNLSGDIGGRDVYVDHLDEVKMIEYNKENFYSTDDYDYDVNPFIDIDTIEDYETALKIKKRK